MHTDMVVVEVVVAELAVVVAIAAVVETVHALPSRNAVVAVAADEAVGVASVAVDATLFATAVALFALLPEDRVSFLAPLVDLSQCSFVL